MRATKAELLAKLDAWLTEQNVHDYERDSVLALLLGFYAGQHAKESGKSLDEGLMILLGMARTGCGFACMFDTIGEFVESIALAEKHTAKGAYQ